MKLKPYQQIGVDTITGPDRSYYLADDMGLGKTVQATHALLKQGLPPVVVICPAAVIFGWERHLIDVGYTPYILGKSKGSVTNALVLSYSRYIQKTFRSRYKDWFEANQPYAILDEAHYLKSGSTKRVRMMLGHQTLLTNCRKIWLLSGTPVTNKPVDLFPVLRAFRPDLIADCPTLIEFGVKFCEGKKDHWGWNFNGASNLDDLKERLDGWLIRRTKEEVMDQLPRLVVTQVPLKLPEYEKEADHIATQRAELAVAKIKPITEFIKLKMASTDKLVVFAYHKELIQLLLQHLNMYDPVKLDGSTPTIEREKVLDRFTTDPQCQIFIGQIQAAGQGIDGLQKVCHRVVFAEPDWSPSQLQQAIDRLRRIGQASSTVFVDMLVARGTVDRQVTAISKRKEKIINELMKGNDVMVTNETIEQAVQLLTTAGAEAESFSLTFNFGTKQVATEVLEVEKPKAKKPKKAKKVESEEKSVEEAVEVEVESAPPAVTRKQIDNAALEFMGDGTDAVEHHALIKEKIFPKFKIEKLDDLEKSNYAAFLDELKKGPGAFKEKQVLSL